MQAGGKKGGAAHTTAPQRRERAGMEWPRHSKLSSLGSRLLRRVTNPKLLTLMVSKGEQGITSAPALRQEG